MKTLSDNPQPNGSDEPRGVLVGMARAWDRFWFSKADPLPLGVIRIFTGIVVLYVHLVYSLDLISMVGPEGWLDRSATDYLRHDYPFWGVQSNWTDLPSEPLAKGQPGVWSVYFHLDEPVWIVTMHVTFLVAMFLFTIGLATRLTAVLTWVGVMSYIQRLPIFMYGMDTIMIVVSSYLMIGPAGATLSVDRLLAKWWARRKGLPPPPVRPSVSANFALRLMQIHFCMIYMASGLSKLQGPAWWNGTAVWGTLANYSFAPLNWPVYVEFLRFLAEHRFLWELLMVVGTYATVALEISFPFLVWRPKLRWLMVSASILMHTAIGLIMGLSTFSLFMFCLVLAFVPASAHHAFVDLMQQKLRRVGDLFRAKGDRPVMTPASKEPALAAGA